MAISRSGQLTGAEPNMAMAAGDQRADARHRTVLQVAKLSTQHGDELCILRNVSAGGLRAEVYCHLAVGDPVRLELRTGRGMAGRVVWTQRVVDRRRVRPQGADPFLSGASGDAGDWAAGCGRRACGSASLASCDSPTAIFSRASSMRRRPGCAFAPTAHCRRAAHARSSPRASANAARWCAGAATARSACNSSGRYASTNSRNGERR